MRAIIVVKAGDPAGRVRPPTNLVEKKNKKTNKQTKQPRFSRDFFLVREMMNYKL